MLLIVELLFIVLFSMMLLMIYRNERFLSKKSLPHAKVEGYWSGSERRRHVRFKETLDVGYMVEKRPHLKNSKTADISEGGMKLVLDEKLPKGTILDLQIALPNSKKIVEVEGKIVWSGDSQESDASGKRLFHSGIQFFAIKEPSGTHLANYIRSLCEEVKPQF